MRLHPRLISSHAQLLIEGKDAEGFFEAMGRRLNLNAIQLQNFGGIADLRRFLHAFVRMSDFSRVKTIGIVRDAEGSELGAFKSVRAALENASLPVPGAIGQLEGYHPAVSVMILPGGGRAGMLETLLWETIPDDVRCCIDSFFTCIEDLREEALHRRHKARAMAYLSTKRKPLVSVGDAARKTYWDLDHEVLKPVREFLQTVGAAV